MTITNDRFKAKNGLDANNQTIINVSTPSSSTDATNKGYVDGVFSGAVTSVSGTSGRISSTGGTTPVLDLETTAVTPGSYTATNLTVDAYGRITAASSTSLATVATTGAYSDLSGTPTIDTLLPSQTGNSGKFLTTNGTTASWQAAAGGTSYLLQPVRVATTTNGTLSSAFYNSKVVDGVTLATGDRILIKNQNTASENGVYVVNASGSPTRASDFTTGSPTLTGGVHIPVIAGTLNAGNTFQCLNTTTITIGSTSIRFGPVNGISSSGWASYPPRAMSSSAIAIGYDAFAAPSGSIAIGNLASVSNLYADNGIAIGYNATGSANSISIGSSNQATSGYDVVIGYNSTNGSLSVGSVNLGYQNSVNAPQNFVGGYQNQSNFEKSVVLGSGAASRRKNSISFGSNTWSNGSSLPNTFGAAQSVTSLMFCVGSGSLKADYGTTDYFAMPYSCSAFVRLNLLAVGSVSGGASYDQHSWCIEFIATTDGSGYCNVSSQTTISSITTGSSSWYISSIYGITGGFKIDVNGSSDTKWIARIDTVEMVFSY